MTILKGGTLDISKMSKDYYWGFPNIKNGMTQDLGKPMLLGGRGCRQRIPKRSFSRHYVNSSGRTVITEIGFD